MAAPKSFTAKKIEAIRVFYISVRGNKSKVAQKFHTTRETVRSLSVENDWDSDITKVEEKTRALSNRTIAEHRAITIDSIDKFIDSQAVYAESETMRQGDKECYGFDPPNFERMVKTRELLTGGATDRLDAGDLFAKFDALDDNGKRDFIAKLRERSSRLRSGSA